MCYMHVIIGFLGAGTIYKSCDQVGLVWADYALLSVSYPHDI